MAVMGKYYPAELAEDWDRIGLVCGDPAAPVRTALLVVDITDETVAQAIDLGAELLIAHHPLLLAGVHSVATSTPKGRLLHRMITAGVALYAAHTNADSAAPGVSDALATTVGLDLAALSPLRPRSVIELDKFNTTVPVADVQRVLDAICSAGAGWGGGEYERCAFLTDGTGTFIPGVAATPTVGERGRVNEVPETQIETVMPRTRRGEVLAALRQAHPYEEPAFDVIELAPRGTHTGLGRVGRLPSPLPLKEFTAQVASALPAAPVGVRAAGDPTRLIERVAVCGGAGDSLLGDAAAAGADVFVTADIRHHVASEFLARGHDTGGPALIDAGHWATERPWLDQVAQVLRAELGGELSIQISGLVTDPWNQVLTP